jgi:methionyl-tRNA formyltransferase
VESSEGRFAVLTAGVAPAEHGDIPGRIVPDGDGLALATVDGRLRCLTVQPAGGRPMTAAAYRRGHPSILATPGGGLP